MKQLITREECNKVIAFAESKQKWVRNIPDKLRPNNGDGNYEVCDISDLTWYKEKLVEYALEELGLKLYTASIAVMKYKEGSKFPRHTDRNRTSEFNMDFRYNINVVLNDDFEGGEFWLDDKPVVGNTPGVVYHYNSDQWHEVKEVTRGTRYTTLFYVRDRDLIEEKKLL